MPGSLQGKVALVTGSSSGIGEATARALAGRGAIVVVNSASSVEAGRALAAELPGASYVQADIADPDQARRPRGPGAWSDHGRLDILVNNAGTTEVIAHPDLEAATPEVWRRILDVNVIGTWQVTVAAVPHLRASGDGAVVNVSSMAGHTTRGSSIPYAVSKAAVSHMTELLANVLGPEIRVNAVAPGSWTRRGRRTGTWCGSSCRPRRPCNARAPPRTSPHVIVGLVGARYVTGEIVLVDGGPPPALNDAAPRRGPGPAPLP